MRFIAPGIFEVSTQSHGGVHLSPMLNADMPDDMRPADAWYEEDVKWSLVALKHPAPFRAMTEVGPRAPTKTAYDLALQCARYWYPDIVARNLHEAAAGAPMPEDRHDHPRALGDIDAPTVTACVKSAAA